MKIFKIRNKKTGLFSTGGMEISWKKNGKIWKQLGHVKSHIRQTIQCQFTQYKYDDINNYNSDVEIVVYEVVENEVENMSMDDICGDIVASEVQKEIDKLERLEKIKEKQELEVLKHLASKYNKEIL